jgi:hypothetical protein
LHEPADELGRDVIDRHRAIASLTTVTRRRSTR